MSEKKKIKEDIIKQIDVSVKNGLDEYAFLEKFEEKLKRYLEGRLK